jgi:hypothetical protein
MNYERDEEMISRDDIRMDRDRKADRKFRRAVLMQ